MSQSIPIEPIENHSRADARDAKTFDSGTAPLRATREIAALCVGGAGLIFLALALVIVWQSLSGLRDDASLRLENSVYQLMLADELAQEDGIASAAEQVENLISLILQKEKGQNSPDLVTVGESAARIRAFMLADDRKAAIEELVRFRGLANETDAKRFQSADQTYGREFGVILILVGQIATLIALIYLYLTARTAKSDLDSLRAERDLATTDKAEIEASFDAERRAATELRQKIIDQGRLIKELEAQAKPAKPPPIPAVSAPAAVPDRLNEALETERAKWRDFERNLNTQIATLKSALESARLQITEQDEERQKTDALREEAKKHSSELESARERVKAAEASAKKYETEYTILEWTNTKLKGQNEELVMEISRLKEEMASEFKRFRDQLADLRG